jgi:outer membrane protein assembly factor BamB
MTFAATVISFIYRSSVILGLVLLFLGVVASQEGSLFRSPLVPCWEHSLNGTVVRSMVGTDSAVVLLFSEGGKIQALDVEDGGQLWLSELGGRVASNAVLEGNDIVLVSNAINSDNETTDSSLWIIDTRNGLTRNIVKLPASNRFYLGVSKQTIIVVAESGGIWAVSLSGGEILWNFDLPGRIEVAPYFNGDYIALKSGEHMHVVSIADGRSTQRIKAGEGIRAIAATSSGSLIMGNGRGEISLYHHNVERPAWTFRTGGAIADISVVGSDIYVYSLDNFVYVLRAHRGNVIWRRRTAGRPVDQPLIHNGFMASSVLGESFVEITATIDGKPVNRLELGDESEALLSPIFVENKGFAVVVPGRIKFFGTTDCQKQ